jgi:hypothetical protein
MRANGVAKISSVDGEILARADAEDVVRESEAGHNRHAAKSGTARSQVRDRQELASKGR